MPAFKLQKQKGKVVNINLRKEAAGEDQSARLAADIKIECEGMAAEKLLPLCPASGSDKDAFLSANWNEDGSPRFYGIQDVVLIAKLENADCAVGGHNFTSCTIKNFTVLRFSEGPRADVEFTIQCHPTGAQVGALAEKIKEEAPIAVDAKQGELDL